MKIAVLTWFHHRNYGTALQVSATSAFLGKNGHNVDTVNYLPQNCLKNDVPEYTVSAIVKRAGSRFKKGTPRFPVKYFCDEKKDSAFASFLADRLTFTNECETLTELHKLNREYDAFICGSDQIWSPNNFDPHYFLDFVTNPGKMIAYAPSIGLPKIEHPLVREQMKYLIGRFKHLSIRENHGKELVKKLVGKDAALVCDPTMLLTGDEWREYCNVKKENSKPYVLVYMLGTNPIHLEKIYRFAEQSKLNVKLIPVYTQDTERSGCIKDTVGPAEFVSLIDNAEFVCTDSFHGIVFSLLLHKKFIPFERFSPSDSANQNSRVYNILETVQLRNRLVGYSKGDLISDEIDYGKIDTIIDDLRANSAKFLFDSLLQIQNSAVPPAPKHVLSGLNLCCGCGACENICPVSAIKTGLNADGFISASVDGSKCINCGKCLNVCPFLSDFKKNTLFDGKVYSYKDSRPEILNTSSSGGFAYTMFELFLKSGYAVAGCTFDKTTQSAKHILINSINDLHLLQGSKYTQSEFSSVLHQISDCQTPVALFGTPCQISAAKKVFASRDDIVYIDLICHGVPTYNLYTAYKKHLSENYGLNANKITTQFRYKPKGWKTRYIHSTDGTNSVCFSQHDDPYFKLFEANNCYSEACYNCSWRDCSEADIRIGDYWGERFKDDNTGVSIVTVFTPRGNEAISLLKESDLGNVIEQTVEDYTKFQQTKNIPSPIYRSELMERLKHGTDSIELLSEHYAYKNRGNTSSLKNHTRTLRLTAAYSRYKQRRGNRK